MKTITFYGRIIGKLSEKEPQIIIKDINSKKHKIPIQSGMNLETDFTIGEELKISYSVIPHEILVQRQAANPESTDEAEEEETNEAALAPSTTSVLCLLGVPDDLKGQDAVCQSCPSLKSKEVDGVKEAYCELAVIATEVAKAKNQSLEEPIETGQSSP